MDVTVGVDFRFYEVESKRVILTKHIARTLCAEKSGAFMQKAAAGAEECAKAFARELGARYAPPARVLETRGNCEVARISMGSNYGVVKGVKVEFYEIQDNSDIIAGAKRDFKTVGKGMVFESDLTSAWVQIYNYEDVYVRRGDYVRISSDQTKGFRDKMQGL